MGCTLGAYRGTLLSLKPSGGYRDSRRLPSRLVVLYVCRLAWLFYTSAVSPGCSIRLPSRLAVLYVCRLAWLFYTSAVSPHSVRLPAPCAVAQAPADGFGSLRLALSLRRRQTRRHVVDDAQASPPPCPTRFGTLRLGPTRSEFSDTLRARPSLESLRTTTSRPSLAGSDQRVTRHEDIPVAPRQSPSPPRLDGLPFTERTVIHEYALRWGGISGMLSPTLSAIPYRAFIRVGC